MQFIPYIPFDKNSGELKLWESLKGAFGKEDEGVAFFRYPVFSPIGHMLKEPDVVMAHRAFGIWVLECKGMYIDNIHSVNGHVWTMANWHNQEETPLSQATQGMYKVKGTKLLHDPIVGALAEEGKLRLNSAVALPFVSSKEWHAKEFDAGQGAAIVFSDQLGPKTLKEKLEQLDSSRNQLTDEEWIRTIKVLGGTIPPKEARPIPTGQGQDDPRHVINTINTGFKALDEQQRDVAFSIPEGPQRLRGLAGCGKTVLLAMRAARIHADHPDWNIAFVFFTKSLYQMVRNLIEDAYRSMTNGDEPNWDKLQVLHAWGGKKLNGYYYVTARRHGLKPRAANEHVDIGEDFRQRCGELLKQMTNPVKSWDVTLIDEGQDLPSEFYRIALECLKEPKRLYWAYDEAQGLGTLTVPTSSELFGRNTDGSPILNMAGQYPGGIPRSIIFKKCYRTHRQLLMLAHAVGMGIYRTEGPLQALTTQQDWEMVGYSIVQGDFRKVGEPVIIGRDTKQSPHPVDQPDFAYGEALGDPIRYQTFDTDVEETKWVAQQIVEDLEAGFRPEDILVTGPKGDFDFTAKYQTAFYHQLKQELQKNDVQVHIVQNLDSDSDFFVPDHVTVSNVFRAKGNEAWKVYVCRFQHAIRPWQLADQTDPLEELKQRNQAFTALTRARVWATITGREGSPIFEEIDKFKEHYPEFKFRALSQQDIGKLRRIIDEESND